MPASNRSAGGGLTLVSAGREDEGVCVTSRALLHWNMPIILVRGYKGMRKMRNAKAEIVCRLKVSYASDVGLGRGLDTTFFFFLGAFEVPVTERFLDSARPPTAIGATSSTWSSGSADVGCSGNVNASGRGSSISKIWQSSSSDQSLMESRAGVLPGAGPLPASGIGM